MRSVGIVVCAALFFAGCGRSKSDVAPKHEDAGADGPVFATHPATGTIHKRPFTVKYAIAWTENGHLEPETLMLFSTPDVPCGGAEWRSYREPVVKLTLYKARKSSTLPGHMMRAAGVVTDPDKPRDTPWPGTVDVGNGDASIEVRFDAFEPKAGGALKGAVLVKSDGVENNDSLDGTFEGVVCDKARRAQPVEPPAVAAITMRRGGKDHSLRWVTAEFDDFGLVLTFADAKRSCGTADPAEAVLHVVVPPGPGGTYFTGAPVQLLANPPQNWDSDRPGIPVELDLEPFVAKEGARIKGSLTIGPKGVPATGVKASGGGTFDVVICDDVRDEAAQYGIAPDAPSEPKVSGSFREKPFSTGSALAYVKRRDGGDHLERITLFPAEGVTCATAAKQVGDRVTLDDAAWRMPPTLGVPQPLRVFTSTDGKVDHRFTALFAWAWLDEVNLSPAGRVSGRLYAVTDTERKAQLTLSGAFTATICPAK